MKRAAIIREFMEQKNLKVADIARITGIAYSTIKSMLENGIEKTSYINVCKFCDAIGITVEQLENLANEVIKPNEDVDHLISLNGNTISAEHKKIESIKTNIANNISFYRKKEKLTQSQLADKIGVKTTTVSTWERCASAPDIETLYTICKLFDISFNEMYGVNLDSDCEENDAHYESLKKLIAYKGKALSTEQRMELIKLLFEIK